MQNVWFGGKGWGVERGYPPTGRSLGEDEALLEKSEIFA